MAATNPRALRELILGLAALGAAVLTVAAVVWLNLGFVERAVSRDREAREILAQADAAMDALVNQETGIRGYIISADPVFLEPYDAGRRELRSALARLSALTVDDPRQSLRVAAASRLAQTWTQTFAGREIDFVRRGEVAKAQAIVLEKAGKRQMDDIRATLREVRRTEESLMRARSDEQERAFSTARWMLVFGSLGGLALALSIGGRTVWLLIEARRRAEEAKAYLNAIVEAMPAMLVVKGGEDGKFKLINRAGEELLGRRREELIGKTDHELFPAEQADAFVNADREALANPDGLTVTEEPITTATGVRYLTTRKIGVRTADGADHLVCICTDISHVRAAALALTEALDRAQAADRAKTQFLANMSHEFRTPLNGVSGVAAVLARTRLDDGQRALLDTLRASATTLDALVDDLLALSHNTAGTMDVQLAPFHLGGTVRDGVAEHKTRADSKGLVLEVLVDHQADVHVRGDAPRLRQVLGSLLSNAVKFTDQGRITVRVSAIAPQRYRIAVSDTGIGFELGGKQELFREFAQSDESATRRHGGAGLGLAIARQAALVLGAQLDCHSAPEQGSTFWFEVTLPPATGDVGAAMAAPLAEQLRASGPEAAAALRMLIVDDHPTNRKVLELLLDQLGADWVSVANGQEALEAVATQAFDVILMDIQMPVMDGITATREIRRLELAAGRIPAPVIIVSANCQPEHVQAGRDAGAQRHLAKPVNVQALIDALSDVLADDLTDGQRVA